MAGVTKYMSNDKKSQVLPFEMFDKITQSKFYTIEVEDIKTENDLKTLVNLLFNYPEREFYYYQEKDGESNSVINNARDGNCILSNEWEFNFYRHPKYLKDFLKIEKRNDSYTWEWEQKVAEQNPMFIRFRLRLSEMKRRKLEIEEKIQVEKHSKSTNPLVLKPSLWGVGIDLEKTPRWANTIYKKLREKND